MIFGDMLVMNHATIACSLYWKETQEAVILTRKAA
jgi:hypothetical protein